MDYTYVAVGVFAFLALFVPVSMLFLAKIIGARPKQNPIKLENYESAESPIGTHRDITNDYLQYFPIYLGFEIVLIILLSWVLVSSGVSSFVSFAVLLILIGAFVLSVFGLALAQVREKVENYGGEAVY